LIDEEVKINAEKVVLNIKKTRNSESVRRTLFFKNRKAR